MSATLTTFDNALWILGFAGHIALLTILVIRRCAKAFPIFTSRIGYQVLGTILLFTITQYGSSKAYFWAYWLFAAGDYLLQMGIIAELARHVLRPTGTWIEDARARFLLLSSVAFVIASAFALAIAPPGHTGFDLWSIRSLIFTSILTCEVFLAMALAAHRLGLHWSSHVMAIGEGLTVWALFSLITETARFATGWRKDLPGFVYADQVVYLASLVFWSIAFFRPEPRRKALSPSMREYLGTLHQTVQNDLSKLG